MSLYYRKGGEDIKAGKDSLTAYPILSSSIWKHSFLYSVWNAFFTLMFSLFFLYAVSSVYCTNHRQPYLGDVYVLGELGWSREEGSSKPASFPLWSQHSQAYKWQPVEWLTSPDLVLVVHPPPYIRGRCFLKRRSRCLCYNEWLLWNKYPYLLDPHIWVG